MISCHYCRVDKPGFNLIFNSREIQKKFIALDIPEEFYEGYLGFSGYWQSLEFLIRGDNYLNSSLDSMSPILGGHLFSKTDEIWFDFGPMRYFEPNEVQDILKFLHKNSSDVLLSRYDPVKMAQNDIDPAYWEEDTTYFLEVICEIYTDLVSLFQAAFEHHQYVILYAIA